MTRAMTHARRAAAWMFPACALLVPLLAAPPAHAWWRGGWGWGWRGGVVVGPPIVVAPPPVVVAPPPIVAVAPPPVVVAPAPYARWVRPHYDRWGRWVPGHWV